MSDWQPGDLTLCVSQDPHWADIDHPAGFKPQLLCTYTVAKVGFAALSGITILGLQEDVFCEDYGFNAANFRKIRPHTPDAEDAETIALLTGTPAQVPA